MSNVAIEGEYIPKGEHRISLEVVEVSEADKKKQQQEINERWINRLQGQLKSGKQKTLSGFMQSLSPNLKKAVFVAARLTRTDMETPFDELTGKQRHQIFIGLNHIYKLCNSLQKSSLFCLDAFKVGENQTTEPPTKEEQAQIDLMKKQRREQQRQEVEAREQENA